MRKRDNTSIGGILRPVILLPREHEKEIIVRGLGKVSRHVTPDGRVRLAGERHNAFVNKGLQIMLDRLFGIGGPPGAITRMGVSADDQAAAAGTTQLDPSGGDAGFAAVALTNVSRTNQTVHCEGVYSQATVAFAINKVGLLTTSADDGSGLINVIGGSGGSSPYDEPFTIDLTGADTWDLTLGLDVTASAT